MGRKIPAKKHRGVKDPLEQQARRLQSLKGKINAPPSDPDEQPVPRSLLRLFALNPPTPARAAHANRNQNNKKQPHYKRAGAGSKNPVSRLRSLPGESAREFSRRINSAVAALHDTPGELHYPGDEEDEEDAKGARMAELRERRARKKRRAAATRPTPAARADDQPPTITRTQKQALKRKAKKEKAEEWERDRREVVYERVPFGDVAHAPPALRPPRLATTSAGAPRPGRRGLLLSAMLGGSGGVGKGAAPPAAEARRLERARNDAVAAYRALKQARARKPQNATLT